MIQSVEPKPERIEIARLSFESPRFKWFVRESMPRHEAPGEWILQDDRTAARAREIAPGVMVGKSGPYIILHPVDFAAESIADE